MIFAAWFVLWFISADTSWSILSLAVALALRGCYAQRKVTLLTIPSIIAAGIVVLTNLPVPGNSVDAAILRGLQVLIGSAFLIHTEQGLSELRLSPWPQLAFGLQSYLRIIHLVAPRVRDTSHAFWRRRRSEGLLRGLSVLRAAAAAVITEMVVLRNQVLMVVEAKGGPPADLGWKDPPKDRYAFGVLPYRALGDLVLLTLMLLPVAEWSHSLIPRRFLTWAQAMGKMR